MQTNIPDQKLKIGATMGLITSIISVVWTAISIILVFAMQNLFTKTYFSVDGVTAGISTLFIVMSVITSLISIAISIFLAIMCNNILKGKAKNGLATGIIFLVLAGINFLFILGYFHPIFFITIIISGVNIAAGVLLVIGKYLPNKSEKPIIVEATEFTN